MMPGRGAVPEALLITIRCKHPQDGSWPGIYSSSNGLPPSCTCLLYLLILSIRGGHPVSASKHPLYPLIPCLKTREWHSGQPGDGGSPGVEEVPPTRCLYLGKSEQITLRFYSLVPCLLSPCHTKALHIRYEEDMAVVFKSANVT